MNALSTDTLLQTFLSIFPSETSVAVSDSHQFIYYQPSKVINLNIKPGDKIRKGSATYQALNLKKKIFTFIDSDIFGVSYYGLSVPIIDEGQSLGCVTAVFPMQTHFSLPTVLTVRYSDRWVPVPIQNILYLEAENRKTKIVGSNITGTHKYNLSDIEILLPGDTFVRCHRSFIVNVNEIAEIQPDFHSTFLLIMRNGDRVPVSQSFASHFRKMLIF